MANRVCVLCGAKYDYCPNCDADKGKPIWMTCWDKAECHDIWEVLSGYNSHDKTAKDVVDVLNKYNVTDFTKYGGQIEADLKAIVKEVKGTKTAKAKSSKNVATSKEKTDEVVKENIKDKKIVNSDLKTNIGA